MRKLPTVHGPPLGRLYRAMAPSDLRVAYIYTMLLHSDFCTYHRARIIILVAVFITVCLFIESHLNYKPATHISSGCNDKGFFQAAQYGVPLLRPQQSFSSVECKGNGDQLLINSDTSTTCLFSNVLYKDGTLTIYEDSGHPLDYFTSDIKSDAIPEHFLAIASGPISAHGPNTWLKVRILPAKQFPQTVIYERTKLNVLYDIFAPYNQGHFMFDEVLPIFQSLLEMGLHGLDPQIITLRSCNIGICEHIYDERMHVITSKPVIPLDGGKGFETYALQRRYKSNGIMFQNVLIGVSQYSYGMRDPRRKSYAWQLFRHLYLTNLALSTGSAMRQQITIIVKHGNRALTNGDDLQAALEKLGVPVVQIHGGKMSHTQELEVLTRTTVLLTPPGGVSMLSAYLPRTSVAIIIDGYLAKNLSVPFEGWWWDTIKPFHYIPYHLESDEVLLPEILKKGKGPLTKEMRDFFPALRNQTYANLTTLSAHIQWELWINFVNTRLRETKVVQMVSQALSRVERTMSWRNTFKSINLI